MCLEIAAKTIRKANDAKYYNFRPLVLLGMYSEKDLYLPDVGQDLAGWKAEVIKSLCPHMPENEMKVMVNALETPMFKDINFHSTLQAELKAAMDNVAMESFLGARYQQLQLRVDDPSDLYMGSRAVADFEQAVREHAEDHRVDILTEIVDPIKLLKQEDVKPDQIFAVLHEVENYLETISLLGHQDRLEAEKLAVSEIIKALKDHSDERVRKFGFPGDAAVKSIKEMRAKMI